MKISFWITVWIVLARADSAPAQEWPRFRGPNGAGVSSASLPTRWTDKDYLWKIQLPGVGHSSPVLWGKRLFVTAGEEGTGKRIVRCIRADDGKTLWTKEFPGKKHGKHADNSFATATPAVDARHVYLAWGGSQDYLIVALDHEGREQWRRDLGPFKSGHGFGASPIVWGDLVIVANDQDGKSALVALDRAKGEIRWHVPRQGRSSWSTPCVLLPAGQPAQLIFTNYEHGITSLDPQTGKKNWEVDVFSKGHIESSIASPIVAGDLVLGTCGWLGVKKEVIAVRPEGKGAAKVRYRLDKSAPLVTTPLVVGDLLFLWSDLGIVTCADVQSGKVHWQERVQGNYYGSPVCAGRHLYCQSREGDAVVLEAGKKFKLVAQIALGEGSHATPAVAGSTMYLRTFSRLMALRGKPD